MNMTKKEKKIFEEKIKIILAQKINELIEKGFSQSPEDFLNEVVKSIMELVE